MRPFSGNPADLSDAIDYELGAIDYLRFTVYNQAEAGGEGLSLVVGDLAPDGTQKVHSLIRGTIGLSDRAVRSALNRFRPLAFSATFKLQDMVAEWILRANAVTDWRFVQKLAAYDRLSGSGSLAEPALFATTPVLSSAFWALYRYLAPFRNTATHAGGVGLESDGTISIARKLDTLRFSPSDQAAYMRAVCLTAKVLAGLTSRSAFLDDLIHADLFALSTHHRQGGLTVQQSRLEALTVRVPRSGIESSSPLTIKLDFDHFRRTMERAFPVGANGRLYYSIRVAVEAEAGPETIWQLPVEEVPLGVVTMRKGDAAYDRFLQIGP